MLLKAAAMVVRAQLLVLGGREPAEVQTLCLSCSTVQLCWLLQVCTRWLGACGCWVAGWHVVLVQLLQLLLQAYWGIGCSRSRCCWHLTSCCCTSCCGPACACSLLGQPQQQCWQHEA